MLLIEADSRPTCESAAIINVNKTSSFTIFRLSRIDIAVNVGRKILLATKESKIYMPYKVTKG